jgi:hypothetical protein
VRACCCCFLSAACGLDTRRRRKPGTWNLCGGRCVVPTSGQRARCGCGCCCSMEYVTAMCLGTKSGFRPSGRRQSTPQSTTLLYVP